jgi:hypothetical protein
MRTFSALLMIFLCGLCVPRPASGAVDEAMFHSLQQSLREVQNTVAGLQETVQAQNEVIRQQGIQIASLENAPAARVLSGPSAQGPLKLTGLQNLNPEIGMTGTVEGKLTESSEDGEGNDTIALKELELSVAQAVDPYSRLDAIIAFNDNLEEQNVDIEEAYYSHWALPLGFRGQIGKFRAKIGKQNLQHLHQLKNSDYALVVRDFFGEEGLSSSGARLVHDIPLPGDIPLEITGEVLRGNNGNSFSGISRRPVFNTHAKTAFELSEDANLELGWTTLFGDENPPLVETEFVDDGTGLMDVPVETAVIRSEGTDRYGVKVYGADATLTWNLPEGKTVLFQNELYFQRRGGERHPNKNPWGFYSLIDYRLHRQFSAGTRFDYLEPLGVADQHHATFGISPYLTFHQSEFANFKLQYSRTEPADSGERSNNEVFLTANFLIGSHKHPVT